MIVPIVHPKELRLKQLRKEAEMQPGATHQGEGTCGQGEPVLSLGQYGWDFAVNLSSQRSTPGRDKVIGLE